MAGRLEELRVVDPILTDIARGYSNEMYIADKLFPIVNSPKESGKIILFGKEHFLIYDTERALRAGSNFMKPSARTTSSFVLDEHDLAYPVDRRELKEDLLNLEESGTLLVTEGLALKKEVVAATLATTTTTYASGNSATLSGAGQFSHASSTPLVTIENAIETVRAKIGRRPNTIVMGPTTYKALRFNASILDLIKYSERGVVTKELLGALVNIKPENIHIGEAVKSDTAGTFSDVWGDCFILAYIPETPQEQRSLYVPSFAYTVAMAGYPQIDTFDTEGGKVHNIRNTDFWKHFVVGSDAGYLMLDCVA